MWEGKLQVKCENLNGELFSRKHTIIKICKVNKKVYLLSNGETDNLSVLSSHIYLSYCAVISEPETIKEKKRGSVLILVLSCPLFKMDSR